MKPHRLAGFTFPSHTPADDVGRKALLLPIYDALYPCMGTVRGRRGQRQIHNVPTWADK